MKKLTEEEKVARREERGRIARLAEIENEKNQKPVKFMTISIEWKNSRTWGANPYTSGHVRFQDGTGEAIPDFTCSGCGYDKESTVLADVFNMYLKYMLWNLPEEKRKDFPYGAYVDVKDSRICFNGGVGAECYPRMVKALGGEMYKVASGKMFDAYTVEF